MRKTSPPEPSAGAALEVVAEAALRKALQPKSEPTGPKPRKMPIRTCVACRTARNKRDLVRIVRTTDGVVELDATGKLSGRGAYLCPQVECLKTAVKRRALNRALGVEPPPDRISALESALSALAPSPQEV